MTSVLTRLARAINAPAMFLRRLLYVIPRLPFDVRAALDIDDRPHYLYGIHRAALQAKALGIPAVTAVEFGVGSGTGLLAMERIARDVEAETGVRIDVVGFDTGEGLPAPQGYRDLPYLYGVGFYPMDVAELKRKLTTARLVLGDVKDTVGPFLDGLRAPIGFVAQDLDYYSSTVEAMAIFQPGEERTLPRAIVYFDDIANSDAIQSEYTGQPLAIREYNNATDGAKFSPILGLRWDRAIPARWNDQMYAFHDFQHSRYNDFVVQQAPDYVPAL